MLLTLMAVAGTVAAIVAFFASEGIGHTQGIASLIGSCAIMAVAAFALLGARGIPRWLRGIVLFLLLCDILATGMAGWFVESWVLMACMAFALFGWFLHLVFGPPRRTPPSRAHLQAAA